MDIEDGGQRHGLGQIRDRIGGYLGLNRERERDREGDRVRGQGNGERVRGDRLMNVRVRGDGERRRVVRLRNGEVARVPVIVGDGGEEVQNEGGGRLHFHNRNDNNGHNNTGDNNNM